MWKFFLAVGLVFGQQPNEQNTPARPPRPPSMANIAYGPHAMNTFDLYLAKSDQPTPLVI